ncbi:hypothetical protein BCL69_1002109 [Nitrosomonas communis]|jgi:hypothetical protein|uniref:Uncharacterized protein n=1 Tax=Nitrosomonas communis TaxID=44574 RepID=A0A5D3YL41_9PROT|nr:hypothetical protein BCL69_1002109 [Nitrosomonas communis]SFI34114.1 hypothetical protein SAMN05428978_100645 [Nitrosomonas sp. Nm34]
MNDSILIEINHFVSIQQLLFITIEQPQIIDY